MAQVLITPSIIAKEALFQLENKCVFADKSYRSYVNEFRKIGDTVSVRKPVKFRTTSGATISATPEVQESSVDLKIDQRHKVNWKFNTNDLTLTIEEYSKRYIEPACIALANKVDQVGLNLYSSIWNQVGTPGTTPSTFANVKDVAVRMDRLSIPSEREIVCNPDAAWGIAGGLTGVYNAKMVEGAYRNGTIGRVAGFGEVSMDQNVVDHTVGLHATGSTPLMAATSSEGDTTLATDGWAASTAVLKAGDVFTVAATYDVNVVSGQKQNFLKQFTSTADVTSAADGTATISVAPTIVSGAATATTLLPYQTVDVLPQDNAAITVMGTESTAYPMNLCFHRNAFALAFIPLEMPDGCSFKARESKNGFSIRVIKDYDFINDEDRIRLDILFGWKAIYPELAVRLIG